MQKTILSFLCLTCSVFFASAQTSPSPDAKKEAVPAVTINEKNYRIFDAKGNSATLQQIIDRAGQSDVIFLGEQHDDAVAHYIQMEVFRKVVENYMKSRPVSLSMEMFEKDEQIVLNEYLQDLISEKKFLDDSRPWNNYKTDYRPLVEYAKQNHLPVIAANAPRRYVNMVSRNGRDSLNALSPEAKSWLAPLPFAQASDGYKAKFNALMGGRAEASNGLDKILDSQTLWDTTMSYSISQFLKKQKDGLVVHLNGAFHTESRLGTAEQLLKFMPKARTVVVTMRYEDDFQTFDKSKHQDLGDFVILTDSKIPRSFKSGS